MEHPAAAAHAMLPVLLLVLDLGGTVVFAVSGAMVAVRHRPDIFSVLVLAFAAGNVGGITRDVLIGAVPPAAIADLRYSGVSALAGLLTFFWYPISAPPSARPPRRDTSRRPISETGNITLVGSWTSR
ncbi:MAG TPA: TRIC cation channel family protein [Rhodanobacteraceae bacterium]|nr:TRIC cation channel family protein [Rhodanobacteraceae bacterium]